MIVDLKLSLFECLFVLSTFDIELALYELRIMLTWKTWLVINVEIYVKTDISNKSLGTSLEWKDF